MALGVTACNQHIYDAFVNDDTYKTFFHGHSFTANPLACTAALASLDLLETEDCREKIDWICLSNTVFAQTLATGFPVKEVRVCGTILAFEITQGKDGYLNSISSSVTQKAMQKGVYLRPLGNTVYLMPPYCITEEELGKVYQVILDVLKQFN